MTTLSVRRTALGSRDRVDTQNEDVTAVYVAVDRLFGLATGQSFHAGRCTATTRPVTLYFVAHTASAPVPAAVIACR